MKWLKSRTRFIKEMKLNEMAVGDPIRNSLSDKEINRVAQKWGEKYLDYKEIEPTKKIEQGKWKISKEDKFKILDTFFNLNYGRLEQKQKQFENLPDKFTEILSKSLDYDSAQNEFKTAKNVLKDLDIKNPSIDQMIAIFEKVFRKLSVNETKGKEMIQKDENGRPVKDENGNIIKIEKEIGAPVFTNNYVDIITFSEDYNKCYSEEDSINIDYFFQDYPIQSLRNLGTGEFRKQEISDSEEYMNITTDFSLFDKDMYLYIKHDPKSILNMSMSKFYTSCQFLYTDRYNGDYNKKLLANVFDPNTIPAFLLFDTPLYEIKEDGSRLKITDYIPLTRMVIRNIENYSDDENTILFFDRTYPDRMKDIMDIMVEKYSKNEMQGSFERTVDGGINPRSYLFTPDVDYDDFHNGGLTYPYQDALDIKTGILVGQNIKQINFNSDTNWKNIKISEKNSLKEIIVDNTELPLDFFKYNFDLDWIKFKNIKIYDIEIFNKIKSTKISFERCDLSKISNFNIKEVFGNVENLSFISCEIKEEFFINLEINELELLYSYDGDLKELLSTTKFNKLTISGDLISENKQYISELKNKKVNVEIKGLIVK